MTQAALFMVIFVILFAVHQAWQSVNRCGYWRTCRRPRRRLPARTRVTPGLHRFEDDLPKLASYDDLTASMTILLVDEIEEWLGKIAEFQARHGDLS